MPRGRDIGHSDRRSYDSSPGEGVRQIHLRKARKQIRGDGSGGPGDGRMKGHSGTLRDFIPSLVHPFIISSTQQIFTEPYYMPT